MPEKTVGQQCADTVYRECVMPHGDLPASTDGTIKFSQLYNVRLREDQCRQQKSADSLAFSLRQKFITWIDSQMLTPSGALDLLDERLGRLLAILNNTSLTCHLVNHPCEQAEDAFSEAPRHAPFPGTSPHDQFDLAAGTTPQSLTQVEVPFAHLEQFVQQVRQSIVDLQSSHDFLNVCGTLEVDVDKLHPDAATKDTVALKAVL